MSFADTLHNTLGRRLLPLVPFRDKVVDQSPESVHEHTIIDRAPVPARS